MTARNRPGSPHEVLRNPDSPTRWIESLPAHPHEGAVSVPPNASGARGVSDRAEPGDRRNLQPRGRLQPEDDSPGNHLGRGIAESSFHHFEDWNWDLSRGAPSFVTEPEGDGMRQDTRALAETRRYVRNLALWLKPAG